MRVDVNCVKCWQRTIARVIIAVACHRGYELLLVNIC